MRKLNLLLKVISEMWRHDQIKPGVVIAWMDERQEFYISIARYPNGQKSIVTSLYHVSLDEAVDDIARTLVGDTPAYNKLIKLLDKETA